MSIFRTDSPGFTMDPFQRSRISNRESQGTNEDRSQNDPHTEVSVSLSQSAQELSPEETFYRDPSWSFANEIYSEINYNTAEISFEPLFLTQSRYARFQHSSVADPDHYVPVTFFGIDKRFVQA